MHPYKMVIHVNSQLYSQKCWNYDWLWILIKYVDRIDRRRLYCDAWSCWCSCMGSVSVSSCRCMFVSCVHPVAVLNAAFCMRLLVYYAGSGVNRVVLSGFSKRLFCLSMQKLCVCMVVCISWLHSYLCVWMWLWWRLHMPWPEPVQWVVVSLRCKCWIVWVKGRVPCLQKCLHVAIVQLSWTLDLSKMCIVLI